jgi:hypothetical protein
MDYVTRQFINLTKKLRKDLRKALSTLHGDIQKQTEAISKQTQRSDTQYQPNLPPPILRAELHVPEDVEGKRKTREDRQHRLQVWIVIGTWAAFFAASVYAYIAVRQWREMIAARHQAQSAVDAAGRSAAAAEGSLQQAQRQTDFANRAWIRPTTQPEPPLSPNQVLRGKVKLLNAGKGPAGSIKGYVVIKFYGLNEIPAFKYGPNMPNTSVESNLIFPNDPSEGDVSVTGYDSGTKPNEFTEHRVTSLELDNFLHGRNYIAVHGSIEYIDLASRKRHWITFCDLAFNGAMPGKTVDVCSAHNQVDSD